jgi:16S rRNA (cytosine1402-N4)-methyltransferase
VAHHTSVLLADVLELLAVRAGGSYVDGTVGLGGHAEAILERCAPDGRLFGVDKDQEALELAQQRLLPFGGRARLLLADFRALPDLLGHERPDGILLDLGMSSLQLDTPERGFSFKHDGPLDMRMDRSAGASAAELVNRASEPALQQLLHAYGEEPRARRVARAIVTARRQARIRTTLELAAIVRRSAAPTRAGLDPATRSFQALRIAVNRELERLGDVLQRLARCLAPGGRLAVIAFHSLEDREVKQAFRALLPEGFFLLTRKPLAASDAERQQNPRARSAKLRAIARATPEPA